METMEQCHSTATCIRYISILATSKDPLLGEFFTPLWSRTNFIWAQ